MKRVLLGLIAIAALTTVVLVPTGAGAEDEVGLWASTANARNATWAYLGERSVALMFLPAQNATGVSIDVTDCPMFTSELHETVPSMEAGVRWFREMFLDPGAEPGNYTIRIHVTYTDELGGTVEHVVDHPFECIRAIEVKSLTANKDGQNTIRVVVETFIPLDVLGVKYDSGRDLVLEDYWDYRFDVGPGTYVFSTEPGYMMNEEGEYTVRVTLGGSADSRSFLVLDQTVKLTIEKEIDFKLYISTILLMVSIVYFFLSLFGRKRSQHRTTV